MYGIRGQKKKKGKKEKEKKRDSLARSSKKAFDQ
jgi:hypothetical protein